jgi:hypothetical protein
MSPDQFDAFADLLRAVYGYYGKDLSEDTLAIWWGGVKHMDLAAVRDALNRHVQNPDTGQFVPKIADIVKMGQGSTGNMALRAWTLVDQAVRTIGPYRSVTFDDRITMRVLQDMGGWAKFANTQEQEWPFVAKEFQNRYSGYRVRSEIPECPDHLVGIAEAQNVMNGMPLEPVMLIGNQDKAREIRLNGTKGGTQIAFQEAATMIKALR